MDLQQTFPLPKTKLRKNREQSSYLPEEPRLQQGKGRVCVPGQAEVLGSSSPTPAQPSLGASGQNRAGALTPGHRVRGAGDCTSCRTLHNTCPKGAFLSICLCHSSVSVSQYFLPSCVKTKPHLQVKYFAKSSSSF